MPIEQLKPCLYEYVRITHEPDGIALSSSDSTSMINEWAEEILHYANGSNTVDDICQSLAKKYTGSNVETIKNKVIGCLEDVWESGIYFDSSLDDEMCRRLYYCDGYTLRPTFCDFPDVQLSYTNPCFKEEMFSDPAAAIRAFVPSAIVMSKIDPDGKIVGIIVLTQTSCRQTYTVGAIFGEMPSIESWKSLKNCLHKYLSNNGVLSKDEIDIDFLWYCKEDDLGTIESIQGEVAFVLRDELPNGDIIVVRRSF